MGLIRLGAQAEASVPTPAAGKEIIFVDAGHLKIKHPDGSVDDFGPGITLPLDQSDIVGLVSDLSAITTALAGKAAASHTHAESDVTGLIADLAAKQTVSNILTAIAGLSPASGNYIYFTGPSAVALGTISAFWRGVLDDADLATAQASLGITGGGGITQTDLDNATKIIGESRAPSSGPITLAVADIAQVVRCTNASPTAIVITMPSNASVSIPIDSIGKISRAGTGPVSFAQETGANTSVIRAVGGNTAPAITDQYTSAFWWKQGTNTFWIEGSIV